MKAAPIQLQQLSFRRINVELDVERQKAGEFDQIDEPFVFDGALIATQIGFSSIEQEDGPSYLLTLRVVVDNKPADDGSEPALSPYLLDIEAGAVVRITKGAETLPDIEDIALVNGTSLLWSAIREQVSNLTARMPLGGVMLPTVHFQGLRHKSATSGEA